MPPDLWNFSLNIYAQPGVEHACLQLQASGANVCTLLCGAWLGHRGVLCSPDRLSDIRQLAAPWYDDVVQPLRAMRVRWRDAAADDSDLNAVREQIKRLELEAERTLLSRLETLTQKWPGGVSQDMTPWLEELAADAAKENHDALQVLRVAANQT
jgi:uncharacterized protein (TIGR02444 family)